MKEEKYKSNIIQLPYVDELECIEDRKKQATQNQFNF